MQLDNFDRLVQWLFSYCMWHTTCCCCCCSPAPALLFLSETMTHSEYQKAHELSNSLQNRSWINRSWINSVEDTRDRMESKRGATKLHSQKWSRGMPHIREKGLSNSRQHSHNDWCSTAHQVHPSKDRIPQNCHLNTTLQLCFCCKLFHLHSVTAHGLLNKEHANSQITQWIITENTRSYDKPLQT